MCLRVRPQPVYSPVVDGPSSLLAGFVGLVAEVCQVLDVAQDVAVGCHSPDEFACQVQAGVVGFAAVAVVVASVEDACQVDGGVFAVCVSVVVAGHVGPVIVWHQVFPSMLCMTL